MEIHISYEWQIRIIFKAWAFIVFTIVFHLWMIIAYWDDCQAFTLHLKGNEANSAISLTIYYKDTTLAFYCIYLKGLREARD